MSAARRAFEGGWATATPGERSLALLRLADKVEEHGQELAELESDNAGKPLSAMVDDEIPFMVDNLRFFAGAARCLEGRAAGEYTEGYTSIIRREPVGVIGQISPWNYPLMMAVWKIGPALAAGNTIVLKPAETTPVTTLRLAELAAEVLPPGVLNVITGHGDPAGRSAGHPPAGRHGLADRLGRHRQVDRRPRRRHAQAGPPGARGQGAGRRVRRRRDGDGARDDRRHRLLQRRPGLHRRHPGARRRRRARRGRERPRRAGPGPRDRRHARRRTPRSGRSTPRASAIRVEGFLERRPGARRGRHRRQRARSARASTSSRRSSPGSSRTTR